MLVLIGLLIASRGSLFSTTFVTGCGRCLRMAVGLVRYQFAILDITRSGALVILACVLLLVIQRSGPDVASGYLHDILRCCIAVYSLGILVHFINESNPPDLFARIIPFVLLASDRLWRCVSAGRYRPSIPERLPPVITLTAVLALSAQGFPPHVGLLGEHARLTVTAANPHWLLDRQRWQVFQGSKEWHLSGQKVALIGDMEFGCLMAADMPAYWKYSPLCEHLFFPVSG